MQTITDRIYQIIENERISISEFSKIIGVSSGYFSKQKANKANIGSHILEKIVREYPKINPTWLLLGEGSMHIKIDQDKLVKLRKSLSNIESLGVENYLNDQIFDVTKYITHGAPLLDRLVKLEKEKQNTLKYAEIEGEINTVASLIREYAIEYSMISHIKLFLDNKISINELRETLRLKLDLQQEMYKIIKQYEKILVELSDIVLDFDKNHNNFFME